MRYRKQDENGDYVFGNGQKDFYIDQPEAVAQACNTRLKLFTGEWFLDTTEGTPYLQAILGKNSIDSADVAIRSRIVGTQGFKSLESFESEKLEGRIYKATGRIDTIYGVTNIEV